MGTETKSVKGISERFIPLRNLKKKKIKKETKKGNALYLHINNSVLIQIALLDYRH